MNKDSYVLFDGDISDEYTNWILHNCTHIGMDTETTGLNPLIDKLCLVQISANDLCFLIRFSEANYNNNLRKLLRSNELCKIFHHATFDIRFLLKHFEVGEINNVKCTKISSKLIYGVNQKNSLKDLLMKYLNIPISKEQQTSDWNMSVYSKDQIDYAISDVKYLVQLWRLMEKELIDLKSIKIAQECFDFIPTYALLANRGINNIFDY